MEVSSTSEFPKWLAAFQVIPFPEYHGKTLLLLKSRNFGILELWAVSVQAYRQSVHGREITDVHRSSLYLDS